MHILLLLSLACAPKPTPVSEPVVDEPVVDEPAPIELTEDASATLPPPFSAQLIRESMPVGFQLRVRMSKPEGVSEVQWEVRSADAEGCQILYRSYAEDGSLLQEVERGSTWAELEDHARFPAAQTSASEGQVETALGTLDVFTYVVTEGDEVQTFHFAKDMPGPPVLTMFEMGGEEVFRMETLSRELP
ncbi:MAG: hypothetical protein H6740_00675 [Alphaproteobacteria bacterium]|nr:hypothetical protein [Alphaproteobacteria bacterium]